MFAFLKSTWVVKRDAKMKNTLEKNAHAHIKSLTVVFLFMCET